MFCGQTPLDTKNPSSYTPSVKKEVLIILMKRFVSFYDEKRVLASPN
jgi:hypothetical protein